MSLHNNFGEESLREGARTARPLPSYLTLTLTRMKMFKSDDQMIKSQSHSHSHSHSLSKISWSYLLLRALDLHALLSLSRNLDMRAFTSLSCSLFRATLICVRWIIVFPSHDLFFFYSLSRLPKSSQKPPKSAKSSFSRKACVCLSPSFGVRFW